MLEQEIDEMQNEQSDSFAKADQAQVVSIKDYSDDFRRNAE